MLYLRPGKLNCIFAFIRKRAIANTAVDNSEWDSAKCITAYTLSSQCLSVEKISRGRGAFTPIRETAGEG